MTKLPFTRSLVNNPKVRIFTRDGQEVEITHYNFNAKLYPINGQLLNCLMPMTWRNNGQYLSDRDSRLDLYMEYSEE